MKKVCLINPNNRVPSPYAAIEPPFWLCMIAHYRMKLDQEVFVIDAEAEGLAVEETAKRVNDIKADENIIVVMGANPSVSSTPKMVVADQLLKHIEAKLTGLHPVAMDLPNTIKKPFEGFPHMRYDLLPFEKYRAHNWHCLHDLDHRDKYGLLYTSLGCPFKCEYCNVHTLYGKHAIQYRKMGSILHDIYQMYSQFDIRNIKIWDELFTLDKHRVETICDYIISEGFPLNIWAYARVDTVEPKMLKKMKKAGINWLCYGFESASMDVRTLSNKTFRNSQVQLAIDMTKDAGINILGNFIFGLPGEKLAQRQASLDMAMQENFEYVNFYVALPYPGSKWWDSLKDKPTDWSRFSQFSPDIYANPDVVKFRDTAFQVYFRRPEYLKMINEKFGDKAENHIKEMLKWRIR